MKSFAAPLMLLALSVLAGCASHVSPELRPYTEEESRQLALEDLGRHGLSFDEYQSKKAQLLREPQKSYGFDSQGAMSAERAVRTFGRPI